MRCAVSSGGDTQVILAMFLEKGCCKSQSFPFFLSSVSSSYLSCVFHVSSV